MFNILYVGLGRLEVGVIGCDTVFTTVVETVYDLLYMSLVPMKYYYYIYHIYISRGFISVNSVLNIRVCCITSPVKAFNLFSVRSNKRDSPDLDITW